MTWLLTNSIELLRVFFGYLTSFKQLSLNQLLSVDKIVAVLKVLEVSFSALSVNQNGQDEKQFIFSFQELKRSSNRSKKTTFPARHHKFGGYRDYLLG